LWGLYALPFLALCISVFVFVVATSFDGGVENLEKDDFFGGGQGTGFPCFCEDTPGFTSLLGSYRMIAQ